MKYEIKRHQNGFVLHIDDEEMGYVSAENYKNEVDAFVGFLHTILEACGPEGQSSRYSDRRIHIHVTKGDKCEGPRGETEYSDCNCHLEVAPSIDATMYSNVHTCHEFCPCHKGGIPMPDFVDVDSLPVPKKTRGKK